ncbi:MAG: carboxypeptidase regulatory-like domain-containing protein, partial [Phycisphaerales bacterium]
MKLSSQLAQANVIEDDKKMRGLRISVLISTVSLTAAGCIPIFDRNACTAIFAYGLTVRVMDENGDPVSGATLTLTEGDYVETIPGPPGSGVEPEPGVYLGAGERAGTYTLTVEAEGFEPATI